MQQAGGLEPLDAPAGERKVVSVLFADIVGSTEIITSLGPEDANTALLGAIEAACNCIRHVRGTVAQILGDGVLAVFGAPRAQEDHALRACLAAMAIHRHAERHEPRVRFRVGVSSGEVVAYGSKGGAHPSIRVVGEPVHQAARLQKQARPSRTAISPTTRQLLGSRAETRVIGHYQTTRDGVTEVAELQRLAASATARHARAPVGRSLPKCVGRDYELKTLRTILRDAVKKGGRSILITGEPGIGKSRLIHELTTSRTPKLPPVFRCDFQPAEISQPLASFREVLRRLIIPEHRHTANHGLDAQAIAAFLGDDRDLPDWKNLAPDQKLEISARAIAQAVVGASRDRPCLLICEDIHWADSTAFRLLDRIVTNLKNGRIGLVCSARSTSPIHPIHFTDTIELQPLSNRSANELVNAYLGEDPSLSDMKSTLVRETQGNPFHVEECIAAMVESGILEETADHTGYRLRRSMRDFAIPVTLRSALAARIDQLGPADRDILLHAAAIGRTFDTSLLEAIVEQPAGQISIHLTHLQEKGLIRQTKFLTPPEFTFSHNLIHEVAYDTLLRQHRKQLHQQILDVLEKRSPRTATVNIQRMADHADRAEDWMRAYTYNRRAAARAQADSQNAEARSSLSRALYAAEALGSSPANLRRLAATQLQLAPSLLALGQLDEAHDHLDEAMDTASHINNPRLQAQISSNTALLHWIRGDYAKAIRADRKGFQYARSCDHKDQQVASTIRMGMLFCEAGHYRMAERLLRRGLQMIPANRAYDKFGLLGVAAIGARAYLARVYAELGQFRSALSIGVESIVMASHSADLFSHAFACLSTGVVLIRQGEFDRALPVVGKGLDICDRARLRLLQPLGQAAHAYVLWNLGERRDEARLSLQQAVELSARHNLSARRSLFLCWLAELDRLESRNDEAAVHAQQALDLAKENRERGQEAWAHWTLAKAVASGGNGHSEEAIRHFGEAQKRAKRREMHTLMSLCDLSLSKTLAAIGRIHDASRHANRAKNAFDAMGLRAPPDESASQNYAAAMP